MERNEINAKVFGISKKKDKRNYQSMSHVNKGMFTDVVKEVSSKGGKLVNAD